MLTKRVNYVNKKSCMFKKMLIFTSNLKPIAMLDLQKEINKPRPDDVFHIGNMIQYHLESNKLKKGKVAAFLGVHKNTFNKYFKNRSVHVMILWRISKAVNYNFFMFLGERLKIDYQTKKEKELFDEIEILKKTIEKLEIENSVYKNITGAR